MMVVTLGMMEYSLPIRTRKYVKVTYFDGSERTHDYPTINNFFGYATTAMLAEAKLVESCTETQIDLSSYVDTDRWLYWLILSLAALGETDAMEAISHYLTVGPALVKKLEDCANIVKRETKGAVMVLCARDPK